MVSLLGLFTATVCAGCADPPQPTGPRLGVPRPAVEQQISDGCARFQVRFDAGGAPVIEPIYGTSYCQTNQLKLLSDTAGTFDAATGTLRLAVVMENVGTAAVIPPVRLRFNADSVIRLNAQGEPVGGISDILGYQPDSASTNGRLAYWFYDQSLALAGQPQVLMPGARTQRRWLQFRGTGWTDRVRLKLFAIGAETAPVPAVAPDSVPTSLIATLPLVTDVLGNQQRSQLVIVLFHEDSSQVARQAAVARVGGEVVGGKRSLGTDGWYIIRVISATTVAAIDSIIRILEADPAVAVAGHYSVGYPDDDSWLRPNDGPSWGAGDWQVNPSSGAGGNAALERIAAPLAWGCSTGSGTTRLALVDAGLYGPTDLLPNIVPPIVEPSPFQDHGTRVASVLTAAGDNGAGITGVSWRSALHMRNKYTDVTNPSQLSNLAWWTAIHDNLLAAGRTGASIILFAQNKQWGAGTVPDTTIPAVKFEIARRDNALRLAIVRLRREGRAPLLVISAGNDGIDARYGGYVNVASLYPAQVLVVGALAHSITTPGQAKQLSAGSNRGPLVDIYAPGENVAVLDQTGTPRLDGGTSFAMPLVAGVAALVKSFQPSLPDSALKAIVVGGVVDSVSTDVGARPVLNAYAALRKAAERPGAPLCGNRVWAAYDTIRAERSVTNGVPTDEVLAVLPSGTVSRVNAFHGGKRIQNNIPGYAWEGFLWNPGGGQWTPATNLLPLDASSGGTFWSLNGPDHDLVQFFDSGHANGAVTWSLLRIADNSIIRSGSVGTFPEGPDLNTGICVRMGTSCEAWSYTTYTLDPVDAIAPPADRGFVAVNRTVSTPSVTSWTPCGDNPADQCAVLNLTLARAAATAIYEVDLSSGASAQRWSVPAYVRWLAVSERNDEVVSGEDTGSACTMVFRDVSRPGVSGAARRTVPQQMANCNYPGTGTIAPRVSAPPWSR